MHILYFFSVSLLLLLLVRLHSLLVWELFPKRLFSSRLPHFFWLPLFTLFYWLLTHNSIQMKLHFSLFTHFWEWIKWPISNQFISFVAQSTQICSDVIFTTEKAFDFVLLSRIVYESVCVCVRWRKCISYFMVMLRLCRSKVAPWNVSSVLSVLSSSQFSLPLFLFLFLSSELNIDVKPFYVNHWKWPEELKLPSNQTILKCML